MTPYITRALQAATLFLAGVAAPQLHGWTPVFLMVFAGLAAWLLIVPEASGVPEPVDPDDPFKRGM